jgi:hypothetical protein
MLVPLESQRKLANVGGAVGDGGASGVGGVGDSCLRGDGNSGVGGEIWAEECFYVAMKGPR